MSNVSMFKPRPMDRKAVVRLPMDPEIDCPALSEALRDLFTGMPRHSESRNPQGQVIALVPGVPLRFTITAAIRTYQPPFDGYPSDILFDTLYNTRLRERHYGTCEGFHEYLVLKTVIRSFGWVPANWLAVERDVLCFNYEQNDRDLLTLTVEFGNTVH